MAPFAGRAIKAFRTGGRPGREEIAAYGAVWGVLFDAPHGSLYGGTGTAWDYGAVRGDVPERLFLAGGLGPDNVRRAVETARPWGVDVCSRVESAPGIKDPELLRRLFRGGEEWRDPDPSLTRRVTSAATAAASFPRRSWRRWPS